MLSAHTIYAYTGDNDRHILTNLIVTLMEIGESRRTKELNEILRTIDIKRLHPIMIIALLRTSFAYKHLVPEWSVFLHKAYVELKQRHVLPEWKHMNLDPNVLLRGLLPEKVNGHMASA